jgi:hypothetical protein
MELAGLEHVVVSSIDEFDEIALAKAYLRRCSRW